MVKKKNNGIFRDKKGEIVVDEIGKLIFALIVFLVLLVIITVYITGGLNDQEGQLRNIFNLFG
jgi:hypothetical protein